jgi:hypothetical protein
LAAPVVLQYLSQGERSGAREASVRVRGSEVEGRPNYGENKMGRTWGEGPARLARGWERTAKINAVLGGAATSGAKPPKR